MSDLSKQREEYHELAKSDPEKAIKYIFRLSVSDMGALHRSFQYNKSVSFKIGIIFGLLLAVCVYISVHL